MKILNERETGMNKVENLDNTIILMYARGKPMHTIASEMGIAVGSVYNRLKANGVQTRKTHDYPITEKQRENARKQGRAAKGRKCSELTKKMLSESKYIGGVGTRKKRNDGYIAIYFPDHPCASKDHYVMEHILVMEANIGRHLNEDECVHHINEKRDDNRLCNLLLITKSDHMSYHGYKRYGNEKAAKEIISKYIEGRDDLSIKQF